MERWKSLISEFLILSFSCWVVSDSLQLHGLAACQASLAFTISWSSNSSSSSQWCHWVPHELTTNQKNCHFEVHFLLFYTTKMNYFLIRLWNVMKSGFYMTIGTTNSVAGPRRNFKALPKVKHAPKRVMVTVWWSATSLIRYDFLNSSKIITSEKYAEQTDEPHWKPQGLQPALIDRKGPILLYDNARLLVAQPTLQKLNELGYEVLPHPPYSPDLLPTDYHFFKYLNNFLQGKHFHNEQEAENAFQQFIESWSTDFYNTGISKLISRWQKCVDYNGSYFD